MRYNPIPMIIEDTWKIATCNVRGANAPGKREEINKWHIQNNHTISIIIETKIQPHQHKWISTENSQTR